MISISGALGVQTIDGTARIKFMSYRVLTSYIIEAASTPSEWTMPGEICAAACSSAQDAQSAPMPMRLNACSWSLRLSAIGCDQGVHDYAACIKMKCQCTEQVVNAGMETE